MAQPTRNVGSMIHERTSALEFCEKQALVSFAIRDGANSRITHQACRRCGLAIHSRGAVPPVSE